METLFGILTIIFGILGMFFGLILRQVMSLVRPDMDKESGKSIVICETVGVSLFCGIVGMAWFVIFPLAVIVVVIFMISQLTKPLALVIHNFLKENIKGF